MNHVYTGMVTHVCTFAHLFEKDFSLFFRRVLGCLQGAEAGILAVLLASALSQEGEGDDDDERARRETTPKRGAYVTRALTRDRRVGEGDRVREMRDAHSHCIGVERVDRSVAQLHDRETRRGQFRGRSLDTIELAQFGQSFVAGE